MITAPQVDRKIILDYILFTLLTEGRHRETSRWRSGVRRLRARANVARAPGRPRDSATPALRPGCEELARRGLSLVSRRRTRRAFLPRKAGNRGGGGVRGRPTEARPEACQVRLRAAWQSRGGAPRGERASVICARRASRSGSGRGRSSLSPGRGWLDRACRRSTPLAFLDHRKRAYPAPT
jgi:hypothetical protein